MLIGQFVRETGCGCQVQLLRKFSSVLNVSVRSDMEEEWILKELISGSVDLFRRTVKDIYTPAKRSFKGVSCFQPVRDSVIPLSFFKGFAL